MQNPGLEYLWILDQQLEFRNDNVLHGLQYPLQQFFDPDIGGVSKNWLIEGYKSGKLEAHLHIGITPDAAVEQINFCAVIAGRVSGGDKSVCPHSGFVDLRSTSGQYQISVLISIAEFLEESEAVINLPDPIVRLHTLDECVRLCGNTRKFFETSQRQRGRLSDFEFSPQRKLATLLPLGGQIRPIRIELDEIEREMIQDRPQLIKDFADENGNVRRNGDGQIQCCFAITVHDYLRRILGNVGVGVRLDSLDLFWHPIEFGFNGTKEVAGHATS